MGISGIKYLAGPDLIGHQVEIWQNGKFGMFKSIGTVIKYRKSKGKYKNNYLVRFKGTKKQGEFFNLWIQRGSLTQIEITVK